MALQASDLECAVGLLEFGHQPRELGLLAQVLETRIDPEERPARNPVSTLRSNHAIASNALRIWRCRSGHADWHPDSLGDVSQKPDLRVVLGLGDRLRLPG